MLIPLKNNKDDKELSDVTISSLICDTILIPSFRRPMSSRGGKGLLCMHCGYISVVVFEGRAIRTLSTVRLLTPVRGNGTKRGCACSSTRNVFLINIYVLGWVLRPSHSRLQNELQRMEFLDFPLLA